MSNYYYVSFDKVAPVGQTLVPSFGDMLSPMSNNQSLLTSLPVQKLDIQHSRKVSTIMESTSISTSSGQILKVIYHTVHFVYTVPHRIC